MITKSISLFFISAFLWSTAIAQETTPTTLEEGIRQLAIDIANQMKKRDIKKIAVDDFTDLNGYKSALGDFISEELVTNFYTQSLGNFDVVERRELARVLKEQKLGSTGLLNKKTIARIGEILGIDAIVTGSIAYLGDDIKINARMLGVNDAKVFAAAARKIRKDNVVEELLRQNPGTRSDVQSGSTGIQVQRHDAYYQNSFLRVRAKSINLSNNKKKLALSLEFENISNENLVLALGGVAEDISIVSNKGEVFSRFRVTGVGVIDLRLYKYRKYYSELYPNTKVMVNIIHESNEEIEGRVFTFSANLYRYKGKGYQRFGIGISNIEIN